MNNDTRKSRLSKNEHSFFLENGFVIRKNVYSLDEILKISRMLTSLKDLSRSLKETKIISGSQFVFRKNILQRIVWCPGKEPRLLDFVDERILTPVSQLLETKKIMQIICQAHIKEPNDKVVFPWHQDSNNRGYGSPDWIDVNDKGSFIQTIMAVDPLTKENGALKVIPKSHSQGHLNLAKGWENYPSAENHQQYILLDPGDVVFFGPFLVHGSEENRSSTNRQVFINGFCCYGANKRIYPGCGMGRKVPIWD